MFDKKLELTKEMERTYLIQRIQDPLGTTGENVFVFGGGLLNGGFSKEAANAIHMICDFDYMGAAEYEWGAVPAAFDFLAQQAKEDNLIKKGVVWVGDKEAQFKVFYLCPKPYSKEVANRLQQIFIDGRDGTQKIRLRDNCYLYESLTSDDNYCRKMVGGVELDNGFIYTIDEIMFAKFQILFGVDK